MLSCAAVGVPDARLGELPAAFVVPKHGMEVTEEELIAGARSRYVTQPALFSSPGLQLAFPVPSGASCSKEPRTEFVHLNLDRLPAFAVPVMLIIAKDHEPLPTNAAGKILKGPLRVTAKSAWERRKKSLKTAKAKL